MQNVIVQLECYHTVNHSWKGVRFKVHPTSENAALRFAALAAGQDLMAAEGHWDWVISNPPYSQFRAFLQRAMRLADKQGLL